MSTQLAQKTNDLRQIITGEKMKQQFAAALPQHLSADRFCRIALTALTRTPKLADCTQESLMRCLLDLSAYGIEPDGRRAHLIPYGNQCTLILDWKGLAELAMRSGIIAKLHADIVCENDSFDYNLGEVTKHEINWKQPRGEPYAAYAMARTKDGALFFAVMTKDEIEKIRDSSQGYRAALKYNKTDSPWMITPGEMWKKTAFRRLAKWLPLSAEFRDAVDKEDDYQPETRDVTPKPARAVPIDPFAAPALAETAPVVEAEVEPSAIYLDLMDLIRDANTPNDLNSYLVQCNELADENERNAAKAAVQKAAQSLELTWDKKTGQFITE